MEFVYSAEDSHVKLLHLLPSKSIFETGQSSLGTQVDSGGQAFSDSQLAGTHFPLCFPQRSPTGHSGLLGMQMAELARCLHVNPRSHSRFSQSSPIRRHMAIP